MFQFIEFLRVVVIGLISLGLFGIIFFRSLFTLSSSIFVIFAAILGLLIEPFLRAYHPYREEVKRVIKHVEDYIQEVLNLSGRDESKIKKIKLENALARAIYEFLYRKVEYSTFFTSRVNEQIRFFYFYYFAGTSLRIAIGCSIFALLVKLLIKYTALKTYCISKYVNREFLLGIENMIYAVILVSAFSLISYLLSIRFRSSAKGIIFTELNTRHVFLMYEKKNIQDLARIAKNDEILMKLFMQKIDKEKGIIK